MNKLDGNNRWQTKMMIKEHVEAYRHRENETPISPITKEEQGLIRDAILLPHLKTMVQDSIRDIEQSSNVLRRLHVIAGNRILEWIMLDLYAIRRELGRRNIRITKEEMTGQAIYYICTRCGGQEEKFGMAREYARTEIGAKLAGYIKRLKEDIDRQPE